MTSIYYSPEDYGLTPVGCLAQDGLDYEFHILAIWKDKDGNIYWEEDSGCSCPIPFEDCRFNGPDDHNLGTDLQALMAALDEFPAHERDKGQVRGYLMLEAMARL